MAMETFRTFCIDSMDAYPEQRAMAAFVLAVIVDSHKRGQEACVQADLIHMCLKHLQPTNTHDAQSEPLLLQWLCLCLGKLWEDFPEAQNMGLRADAPAIFVLLLSEPQPEVRASAVFALGTLFDIGSDSCRDSLGGSEDFDDDDKVMAELNIVKSLLNVVSDGSPVVRAEVAIALARFASSHTNSLHSAAAAYFKPLSNSLLGSLPALANISGQSSGYPGTSQYMQHGGTISSQIDPVLRVGSDHTSMSRDGRVSTSSPIATSGIMHGSPLSDDSSQHSDSGILLNDAANNGVINYSRSRTFDSGMYSQCVLAMWTLAKDPSPRVAGLGRKILTIIGIPTKTLRFSGSSSVLQGDPPATTPIPNLAGLARSNSWFDMNSGEIPLTFRTPPVSPPQQNFLTGMRRVCSLDFRPHLLNSPETGLADPLLSERSLLPQSTIYNWSCGHFSRPLLTGADENDEIMGRREERERLALDCIAKCQHSSINKLNNQIASWDTRFEMGTKTALLHPFSPVVIVADETERIRIWDYERVALLNSFDNHNFMEKGISKLCLVNELDDSLLLVASCKI